MPGRRTVHAEPLHVARRTAWYYALRILCALVLLFLIVPVLVIVPLSFNSGSFPGLSAAGFSLRWYEALFTSADWMRSLKNSLLIAPAATLLAVVLGTRRRSA